MEQRRFEIIHEFKGFIGTTEFDDKQIFYTTQFLVENIENRFNIVVCDEFIKSFSGEIDRFIYKSEGLILSEFENELSNCISDENITSFEQIAFSVYGDDYRFSDFNKEISEGKFTYTKLPDQVIKSDLDL